MKWVTPNLGDCRVMRRTVKIPVVDLFADVGGLGRPSRHVTWRRGLSRRAVHPSRKMGSPDADWQFLLRADGRKARKLTKFTGDGTADLSSVLSLDHTLAEDVSLRARQLTLEKADHQAVLSCSTPLGVTGDADWWASMPSVLDRWAPRARGKGATYRRKTMDTSGIWSTSRLP